MSTTRANDAAPLAGTDALTTGIEQLVSDAGHHLYDVVVGGGSLRVLVASSDDRATGVGIDDLAQLSRDIGRLADTLNPGAGRYTLEVSTPGLERPLRKIEHFRSAVGEQVRIKAVASTGTNVSGTIVEGQLVAADDASVTVVGSDGEERCVAHADIRKARTIFDPKGASQ